MVNDMSISNAVQTRLKTINNQLGRFSLDVQILLADNEFKTRLMAEAIDILREMEGIFDRASTQENIEEYLPPKNFVERIHAFLYS